jgi:hypothetical protein
MKNLSVMAKNTRGLSQTLFESAFFLCLTGIKIVRVVLLRRQFIAAQKHSLNL